MTASRKPGLMKWNKPGTVDFPGNPYDGVSTPRPDNQMYGGGFSSSDYWLGLNANGAALSGGALVFTGSTAGDVAQSVYLIPGKAYDVTFTVTGYSAGTVRASFKGGTQVNGTGRTANGTYTERLTALAGNDTLSINISAGTAGLTVDGVALVGPY